MVLLTSILAFAILVNIGLGITVFLTNRTRKVNQAYLVASAFMLLWLSANLLILHSNTPAQAILNIDIASALSTFIPTTFQLLRLAIKNPTENWKKLLKRTHVQIVLNAIVIFLCFLPTFTKAVEFPESAAMAGLAKPIYGVPFLFFLMYMLGSICVLSINVFFDRKILKGTNLLELEFLIFACLSGLIVGVFLGTIVGLVTQSSNSIPIANAASVLTVSIIVAYGITVHKILTVSTLLRKVTAYALMSAYLCAVYYLAWIVLQSFSQITNITSTYPSHLIATLIVTFSMLPARQRMLRATERLFSSSSFFDIQTTMKKAGEIFQSVTTINALSSHFSTLVIDALGAERVTILNKTASGYTQSHPKPSKNSNASFSFDDPVVKTLSETREPICADSLARIRQTSEITKIISTLQKNKTTIAVGIFSKTNLNGVVLFGPRNKGRIYDKNEQDALQILCNQFAVALDNAQMYTEMQDSKIRNEIMLDQLVSGVVVASPERKITLINHEAQRITGLKEEQAIGQSIDVLPKAIADALETTLARQSGVRNVDARLLAEAVEEESTAIRMGSAFLHGHDHKPMGALLVFTDMTELKKLEEQVRRSDQLSSVGTLAAGMAHEIKNPLVTIKTFTQLLPTRHQDDDFRKDFSSLVAHEVARIDGIVNQLLSFSKPSQPHLVPMKLHATVEKTLKLIHEQLAQKNIKLQTSFRAENDLISGDADMLTQALVNLNLNAIDAIGSDGTIIVGSTLGTYHFVQGHDTERVSTAPCIRLHISDNGKGIPKDQMQKIFDPFFTSKSEGTGMGLSVAHGIIREHHGAIEVESEVGHGTTFYIYIPLLKEDGIA